MIMDARVEWGSGAWLVMSGANDGWLPRRSRHGLEANAYLRRKRTVTKEYGSSWIFESCLTWANALRRVQHPGFSLVTSPPRSPATWANAGPHSGECKVHGSDGVAGSIPAGGSTKPTTSVKAGQRPSLPGWGKHVAVGMWPKARTSVDRSSAL